MTWINLFQLPDKWDYFALCLMLLNLYVTFIWLIYFTTVILNLICLFIIAQMAPTPYAQPPSCMDSLPTLIWIWHFTVICTLWGSQSQHTRSRHPMLGYHNPDPSPLDLPTGFWTEFFRKRRKVKSRNSILASLSCFYMFKFRRICKNGSFKDKSPAGISASICPTIIVLYTNKEWAGLG